MSVDAQFTDHSDKDSIYGIVFRLIAKDGRNDTFYSFDVQWTSSCALLMLDTDKWVKIVDYMRSDFINGKTGTNALTVEMVGQEITGSVNGHVLVRATDRRLARGDVGVSVSSPKEYSEARFRNFRLYSIEKVEEAIIMPAPMPAPQRRPSASVDDTAEYVIEKITANSPAIKPSLSKPRVAQPDRLSAKAA